MVHSSKSGHSPCPGSTRPCCWRLDGGMQQQRGHVSGPERAHAWALPATFGTPGGSGIDGHAHAQVLAQALAHVHAQALAQVLAQVHAQALAQALAQVLAQVHAQALAHAPAQALAHVPAQALAHHQQCPSPRVCPRVAAPTKAESFNAANLQ